MGIMLVGLAGKREGRPTVASVVDVAARVLVHFVSLSTMKLQKLVFYSQAYSLVKTGKPLFASDFYAWRAGPVAVDLYRLHRGEFFAPKEVIEEKAEPLNQQERELVDEVVEKLGELSGRQLSERTHSEAPWLDARGDLDPSAPGRHVISKESIADYYAKHPVL